jgi:TonB family protein
MWVVGLAACIAKHPSVTVESPNTPVPTTSTRPSGGPELPDDVELPTSPSTRTVPPDAVPIFIGRRVVRVGFSADLVLPLPPPELRAVGGLETDAEKLWANAYVPALAELLRRVACDPGTRGPARAAIYTDASNPVRVLVEALTTAREIGFDETYLVASPGNRSAAVLVHNYAQRPLEIAMSTEGAFSLRRGDGTRIGTGCSPNADGFSISAGTAGPDFEALRACVNREASSGPVPMLLQMTHATTTTLVVRAIDALGGERPAFASLNLSEISADALAARVGSRTEKGNISNAALVVASMRSAFRACYQALLDQEPKASGTVKLSIKVGADGNVTSATATPSGNVDGAVECVRERALRAKFDPPAGGAAVVNVPVNFVRQEERPKLPQCPPNHVETR